MSELAFVLQSPNIGLSPLRAHKAVRRQSTTRAACRSCEGPTQGCQLVQTRSSTRTRRLSSVLRGQGAILPLLYFLYYCSLVSWTPFFTVYLRGAGLSGKQVGAISAAGLALVLVSQPLWGLLADLRGRRRVLLLTMFLAGPPLLGFAWPGGFWFLFGWTILYGLLAKGIGPLLDSLVLDHLEGRRGTSFGQLRVWGGVAWAVGATVVGRAVAGRDIRLIFAFAAAFMLLAWLVAWLGTREPGRRVSTAGEWRGAGLLLRDRKLVTFLILPMLLYVGTAPVWSFYPIYMTELGATPDVVGLAFTLRGLGELPFYLAAAAIIRRLGARGAIVLTCLAFAGRMFLYSVIRTPLLAIAVEASHGLTFSLFMVASIEYANRLVPREWRATGQTLLWAACFGVGGILGNAWAGVLYDRLGAQGMFRLNSWLVVGVAALGFVLPREGRRPAAATHQSATDPSSCQSRGVSQEPS